MVFEIMAFLTLAAWFHLAVGRGGLWCCAERGDGNPRPPTAWPRLAAIPVHEEADGIDSALVSMRGKGGLWNGRCQAVRAR